VPIGVSSKLGSRIAIGPDFATQGKEKLEETPMTAETNKIVMRRFLEFINTASESLAQELISPDAMFYSGASRTDARSGWLPRYHRDDARRLSRYSMDFGGDCC